MNWGPKLYAALALICLVTVNGRAQNNLISKILGTEETHSDIEDNNRGVDNRIIRGSYLTNQWYDNWVFGLGAGIQSVYSSREGAGMKVTPSFDLTITKWVTPTIGLRFGMQGLKMQEYYPECWLGSHYRIHRSGDDNTLCTYKETYAHADILLNISSLIWGYRETRRFNVIPYVHAGYLRLGHPNYSYFNSTYRDREVAAGLGAVANIRITNHVNATVDARFHEFSGRYHEFEGGIVTGMQLSVGLSYTIHKWYWLRHTTAIKPLKTSYQQAQTALREAKELNDDLRSKNEKLEATNTALATTNTKLEDENKDLGTENEVLYDELATYKKMARLNPDDELLQRLAQAEAVFFFDINSDKLGEIETMRLENYIVSAWNADNSRVFYIVGSADKGTGTQAINARLSRERADNVRKILIRKYGIPASQVVVKASIISDKHTDGRLDRCVMFESE